MAAQSPFRTDLVTFAVKVNGSEIDKSYFVQSISVTKAVNKIPSATIEIVDGSTADEDFPISNKDDFAPGAEIEIEAGYQSENTVIFKGLVVKHGIRALGDSGSFLVLECRDESVKMTVGRKNAIYVGQKDSDIIGTLIGSYSGLSKEISSTSSTQEELVQYYCTDWDFMLLRAEANGMLVIADDGKITVAAPETSGTASISLTYGKDIIDLQAEMDARTQYSSVEGTSWDLSNLANQQISANSPSVNSQGDIDNNTLSSVIGLDKMAIQSPASLVNEELQAWADAELQRSWLSKIQGVVKFNGHPDAKPGIIIEANGLGNRFNGSLYTTSVTHNIKAGGWTTTAKFGLSPKSFSENPDIAAPANSGLLPPIKGLHVGIVKKLDGDPEGQSRIQISLPLLQDDKQSVWARLSNYYATADAGEVFIPEIGDEVLVGFMNEDPRYPVVLGSLYSSGQAPPYPLTAENYTKAIVTKAKLEINFDDEKKVITVKTPGGNSVEINDDAKSITLADQNSNTVTLSEDGITLDSAKDVSITAKGKITIDASSELAMSSKSDITADGTNITATAKTAFTGKGNASSEVSSGGQTTVKGSIVMIN